LPGEISFAMQIWCVLASKLVLLLASLTPGLNVL
jgi:hypothetical protein